MRFLVFLFSCALAFSAVGDELRFNFNDYSAGATPTNFQSVLFGRGAPPVWKVVGDEVPSGFAALGGKGQLMNHSLVLAQTSEDMTDAHYPMFVYTNENFRDFKFSTKFKIVSGVTEQMAGIVFRFQNASNFCVIRISALGKNISFYKVVNGNIVSPVKLALEIPVGAWHSLAVDCSGIYIDCSVDGKKALPTITDDSSVAGKIGFWTKSDSVTHFTDAVVRYTPVVPVAERMINNVLAADPRLLGLRIYVLDGTNATRVIASKDKTEIGRPGTDAELKAIQNGTIFFGRERGAVILTMSVRDRNGDNVGAMRVKMKAFFGETENTALTRATAIRKELETFVPDDGNLKK